MQIKAYEKQINTHIAQGKWQDAVNTSLNALTLLGVKISKKPSTLEIILTQIKLLLLVKNKINSLKNLSKMTHPDKIAAMRILSTIMSVTNDPIFIYQQILLSRQYGNTTESPLAYAEYGRLLCAKGDIDTGYQFGLLALSLLDKTQSKTLYTVNAFIMPWKKNLGETLPHLLEAYKKGIDTQDSKHATDSLETYFSFSFFRGKNLEELKGDMLVHNELIHTGTYKIYLQIIFNLGANVENSCELMTESNDQTVFAHLYLNKLILCYLFQQFTKAVKHAQNFEKCLTKIGALAIIPIFHFYDSLLQLALYPDSSQSEQKRILTKVRCNQRKLRKWALHAPINYQHKVDLVEAECARLLGNDKDAREYYDKAIMTDYLNEESLAYELAGRFYLARGQKQLAQHYLSNAYYNYSRWGAFAKLKALEKQYSKQLLKYDTISSAKTIDFEKVLNASQTLAIEIKLKPLLENLIKILLEHIGAQRAFFIWEKNERWVIEAQGIRDEITVLQSLPINSREKREKGETLVSSALVNYVARAKKSVVLHDAIRKGKFTHDPYIIKHKIQSVLCTPLLSRNQLSGMLYLENNLVTGAFTQDRVEVLNILSSQIIISIENAKFYEEIRQSERQLTQFLEAMPVGVSILDATGKPHYANRVALQLYGKRNMPDMSTNQIASIYQIYIASSIQEYPWEKMPIVRALKGECSSVDDMEIHQKNKIIPLESWGTPIFDENGKITHALSAFQDITERRLAEIEREKFTKELFQLNKAYERFVPYKFLKLLNKKSVIDIKLGDHIEKGMSILFSDIRGFTSLSENMTPQENFNFINSYLSQMEPIIAQHHGFIDKYIGDAIMALFSNADDAVRCSIAMLKQLVQYNQGRERAGYDIVKIGIGLNTGKLMLGTVGGKNRMDGTVISDAVNLAARIEGMTKTYGVELLISENTYSQIAAAEYAIRTIDRVKVKGKSKAVTVYEVFDGDDPQIIKLKQKNSVFWTHGLAYYHQQEFTQAIQCFKQMLRLHSLDTAALIYFKRCSNFQKYGVPEDWDGIEELKSK